MNQRFIIALFFFSGLSSLIYQVIWVRLFGNLFGNTVHSAAMVTSTFMLGLGIGSWLAGKLADHLYKQDRNAVLRVYGGVELLLAIGASLLIFIFLNIDAVAANIAWYESAKPRWNELTTMSYVLRYLLSVGLILPMTTLMGATLTLLIRFLIRDNTDESGTVVGRLYGFNTAGAAAGCLLVDTLLIPRIGLVFTQVFAVAINIAIGLLALKLYTPDPVPLERAHDADADSISRDSLWVAGALACTGFATLSLEIAWFRFLTSVLGQTRIIFSILLGVILVGIWLGSVSAGGLVRRYRHAHEFFMASQIVACVSAVACLVFASPIFNRAYELVPYYSATPSLLNHLLDVFVVVRDVSVFTALPAFALGFSFPLANSMVQDEEARVGRVAGRLYLFNTVGSVIGSLGCGFVLIPLLGIKSSISLSVGVGLLACAFIYAHGRWAREIADRPRRLTFALAPIGVIALLGWQLGLSNDYLVLRSLEGSRLDRSQILRVSEGINESIAIVESDDGRTLYTNSHKMSQNTYRAQRYMRAFSHLPLLHLDAPKSAMIICFGVGNTVHAASLHPSLERLEVVDLSRNVLAHAHYFSETNHDVLADPRLHVFVNDGRHHLRMKSGANVDLITLEPPPISHAGVSALYSVDFYSLAKARLNPDGFVSQWLPIRQQPSHIIKSMIAAFVQVFPNAILLSGDYGELILLGQKSESIQLTVKDYQRRLADRPAVERDLEEMGMLDPVEFFGTFSGDSRTLTSATSGATPITDDLPSMEYGSPVLGAGEVPTDVFNFRAVDRWCTDCLNRDKSGNQLGKRLAQYLLIFEAMHKTDDFVHFNRFTALGDINISLPMKLEVFQALLARHKYLAALFPASVPTDS